MTNEAQQHINVYTSAYEDVFKTEFLAFQNMHRVKVQLPDNKHGLMHGTGGEFRHWGEIPETLFALLKRSLTDEEWKWFQSKDGQAWFFNNHPQYKVAGGKL